VIGTACGTLLVRSDTLIVEPGPTVNQIGLEDLVLACVHRETSPESAVP
jgi:hypothetical protein